MQKEINLIKKATSKFLNKMTFESEVSVETDGETFFVRINVAEPSILIGRGGEKI